jgi:hypothetical protein
MNLCQILVPSKNYIYYVKMYFFSNETLCVVLKIWQNTSSEDFKLSFVYITVRSFILPINFRYLVALWRLTLISIMIDILMKKTHMLEEINWKGNMQHNNTRQYTVQQIRNLKNFPFDL